MSHMVRLLFSRLFLILICLSCLSAFAADSADQVTKRLAGSRVREWVFTKWETFLGPGNQCKQGESYRFKIDHHVTISTCINGKVHNDVKRWTINTGDGMDTYLKIGDISYVLKFWDTPKGHFMALRTKPKTISEPTIDKIFQLEED
jgi:hypothetical protein